MAAGITTHVLDVALGKPAAGMQIELYDMAMQPPTLIARMQTNRDGRTDTPILPSDKARAGDFELRFHVADYFKTPDVFADVVPVRFTVAEAAEHYHVPLLCSPWTFGTYRGS
ncbi:hydroxyisourate hydrolase [Caballeronia sp. LZ065]|uniref:hydroxyisourate hydrolase n=1 Tax=Caballeronia sp. LZ065 TaxID=3038571 RepID=UPI00286125D5|nr:hydroxyisourate hydrolase [Caballeronia sp. LZ065]MDR5781030.1 hydroxyisourate hydrolase [Caballeronia sp. LZ065]